MPPASADASPVQPAPTHRTIAAEAGVSVMTVSLALRKHPSITAATRARVESVAARQGYVPDPSVARLMSHLRVRREKRLKAGVLCLYPDRSGQLLAYARQVLDGAQARSRSLGFATELVSFDPAATPRSLRRIIHHRNTEAVLLLPPPHPLDLSGLLEWDRLCAVSTSLSLLGPALHTVLPDQFRNLLLLCRHLHALGHRRIGLVTLAEHDLRVEHHFVAALGWFAHATPGQEAVPPFVTPSWPPAPRELRDWARTHRPDVLVTDSAPDLARTRASLGSAPAAKLPGYVTSTLSGPDAAPGVDERPAEIGAAAAEQLAALFQQGARGLPAHPRRTLIQGRILPAS